jgi:hypothetical protein
VENFIWDLGTAKQSPPREKKAWTSPSPKWIPAPAGEVKINVDAGVARDQCSGVVAAVARSSVGEYLGASAVVIPGISDPEVLEAMAVREGLCLAEDLLIQRVRIASDCQSVIKALWRRRIWKDISTYYMKSKRRLWYFRVPPSSMRTEHQI